MTDKLKIDIDEKLLEEAKARTLQYQTEVFGEVLSRMPFGAKITLLTSGGESEATIEQVGEPWIADDGSPTVMFDVVWQGGHIEFTLAQSGWGGSVPADVTFGGGEPPDDQNCGIF